MNSMDKGLMGLLGQLGGLMQLMCPEGKEFEILRAEYVCDTQFEFFTNLPDDADDAQKEAEVEVAYMQKAIEKVHAEGMKNIAKIVKKAILAKNRDNIAMWANVKKLSRTDTARMSDEFRLAVEMHRRRALEKQLQSVMQEAEGALNKMMQVTTEPSSSTVTC